MDPNLPGRRPRSLVALFIAVLTALSILQPTAAMAADIAPNLVSLERTSPDLAAEGDEVVVAWEFDAPVESVTVAVRDALGRTHYLYGGWEGGAAGDARGMIDTASWAGGIVALAGVSYSWTVGDTYHYVELDAAGEVLWSSDGLAPIGSAADAIRFTPFEVHSDVDLSIPPTLIGATRLSADSLVDGERLEVAWEFDRPVDSVTFSFRDAFGRDHRAEWSWWYDGTGPATAGTVGLEVDTPAWAGGAIQFAELSYGWDGGYMTIDASGAVVYKSPEGIADAVLQDGALTGLDFIVISDHDPSAVPVLTMLARASTDLVREGDEIVVDWAVDGVVDSVSVVLRDALGGSHYLYGDAWGGAASGQIRSYVDTTEWPAGTVELEQIGYSWIGVGGEHFSVALDASGQLLWSTADGAVPPAPEAIAFAPFTVESDVDLSVPPSLTGLVRTSPEVLGEGEELLISWSADRPVGSVQLTFTDAIGRTHLADWSMWQEGTGPATEGVARAAIDTTQWAGGAAVLEQLSYQWAGGSITVDASGDIVAKEPSGLQDPTVPVGDLDGLGFAVDSDVDLAAVPTLTSVSRVSAEVVRDGEAPAIAWESDRPLQWIGFLYVDGLGRQQMLMWNGDPATSGIAEVTLEGATWAPGIAELVQVRYSAPGDASVVLGRDGTVVSKWPAGVDDPGAYEPGFAALDFTVETDAAFETVTVPEPVFTPATCDAPAHLLLEDFPHGWWSWTANGGVSGDGGESYDGAPWGVPASGEYRVSYTVTAVFEDGWGTTGESQWTHVYTDPGSCEALLDLDSAPAPLIDGDPVVGGTVTAVAGDWQPAPVELAFQWLRDGTPIAGAVQPSLVLTAADAGAAISVEVTGTKAGYVPTTRTSVPVSIAKPAPSVVRIAGDGRFRTYAEASAAEWAPGTEVAYVVNGTDRAAAVAAAVLAGRHGGPLLAVKRESVPSETAVELERLAPERIVVIGGADRVSDAVIEDLGGVADGAVERVSGDGDAGLLAGVSAIGTDPGAEVAYLVDPADAPTSFAAAALAAAQGAPLLAVGSDAVPAATAAELDRLGAQRLVVIGATEVVADSVLEALAHFTTGTVERLAGEGRFGTVAAVAAEGWPSVVDTVYVVNGSDTAALAAGAALSAAGAPLLTVKRSSVTSDIASEIERLGPNRVVVLGDANAVDGSVLAELSALIGAGPA
ncbi:cell wall-binding repeat-containing protein [Agromyces sp. GXS1127]|uniref:cell wall-binding repeat-containing protein n=1 Tax=Agromyces sp. GXS1127 TaxID=3424181 RepID=UPI003D322979